VVKESSMPIIRSVKHGQTYVLGNAQRYLPPVQDGDCLLGAFVIHFPDHNHVPASPETTNVNDNSNADRYPLMRRC
jgi:hypothetical protein